MAALCSESLLLTAPRCHGLFPAERCLTHLWSYPAITQLRLWPSWCSGHCQQQQAALKKCLQRKHSTPVEYLELVESGTCLFCCRNGNVCHSLATRDPNLPFSLNMSTAAHGIRQHPASGSCQGCCSQPPRPWVTGEQVSRLAPFNEQYPLLRFGGCVVFLLVFLFLWAKACSPCKGT